MKSQWQDQKAILLIYPHIFCDFKDDLEATRACYDEIIEHISSISQVILLIHPLDITLKNRFEDNKNIIIYYIKTNDVWARDCIALYDGENYLNFGFNGWGLKFPSNYDNLINLELYAQGFFKKLILKDMILEGGSIEPNGDGLLLTNTQCLLEKNRNPSLSKAQIELKLKKDLKVDEILWLDYGFLKGDDTNSHIDTLARFIKKDTIVYLACKDKQDIHFNELEKMKEQLSFLAKKHHLRLVEIPYCRFIEEKEFLPASYVNFLFVKSHNKAKKSKLLVPLYDSKLDSIVLERLQNELLDYEVVGINCIPLIRQHGSLHCISMQIY